jgi:hypothetical protein
MDERELRYIYRASIRLRNGRRIYAWKYGLKAFKLRVKQSLPPNPPILPDIT